MVYAKDQWIQLPVKDIYDSQIMMASINAARDMYQRGVDQVKEFKKEYGDFFSPIQADMDWYNNNVIDKTRSFINDLYDKGIDPTRSPEGRAMISRYVNNMPTGDINRLKQSAVVASDYIKNRGKLIAEGLWNPEYEKYLLGGRSIEDWDTTKDGLWNRESPDQYVDLNTATTKWFDQLQPSYQYTKNGMDWYGIKNKDLMKTMEQQIPDFVNKGLGKYNYDLAKKQLQMSGLNNPTDKQITDKLKANIAAANAEKLQMIPKINPLYQMEQEYEYQRRLAQLRHRHAMAEKNQPTVQTITPYTQRTEITMQDNINRQMHDIPSVIKSTIDYWKNSKSKDAKAHVAWWTNVSNDLAKSRTAKDYDAVLYRNGLIDKTGNITSRTANAYSYSNNVQIAPGTILNSNTLKKINNSYERYNVNITDTGDAATNLSVYTQNSQPTYVTFGNDVSTRDKRRVINLTRGDYQLADVRKFNAVTSSKYKPNSISMKFNNFLTKDRGVIALNGSNASGLKLYRVPGKNGTSHELSGYVEVRKSDIERFAKQTGNSVQHIINYFGLKPSHIDVRSQNSNNEKQQSMETLLVPMIRVDNASISTNEGIDNTNFKYRYGGSNSYKEANNSMYTAVGEVGQ